MGDATPRPLCNALGSDGRRCVAPAEELHAAHRAPITVDGVEGVDYWLVDLSPSDELASGLVGALRRSGGVLRADEVQARVAALIRRVRPDQP